MYFIKSQITKAYYEQTVKMTKKYNILTKSNLKTLQELGLQRTLLYFASSIEIIFFSDKHKVMKLF